MADELNPDVPATPAPEPKASTPPAEVIDLSKDTAPEVADWSSVQADDPAEQLFIDFLSKMNLPPTDPAVQAAQTGDFTLLEAKLSLMGDKAKGADKILALAKSVQAREAAASAERNTKTAEMLYETFGGEETWKEVQKWAKDNGEPDELAYFNTSFAKGGIAAKAAALYLQECYKTASGTTVPAQKATKDPSNTKGDSTPTNGPLSPQAYAKAVRELANASRGRPENNPEAYAALRARRAAYRG